MLRAPASAGEQPQHSTSTAALENKRDYALSALAVLGWYRREGCGSVEVHARMVCLLTAWHARITLSQVVDEHSSSCSARIYDRTSGGQRQLTTTRTAVQWFAALCPVSCARAIARSTSHGVRAVRGRCLCLSGASRLHVGGPVVPEMDSTCTLVGTVARGRLAA